VIAVINLGAQAVRLALPESVGYAAMDGHGMAGQASSVDGSIELPGYGAWFGVQSS
jgi:hypothetical protein